MRYALGRTDGGDQYALRDPREAEIARAVAGETPAAITARLHALPGLFPEALARNRAWTAKVECILGRMLERGMAGAVAMEAERG